MKAKILSNDSRELEKLYRANKANFKQEFNSLYPDIKGNSLADFWNDRLNYESDEINWGSGKELIFVIIAALVAGFIAKFPAIFSINEEFFYSRNVGFIIFPILSTYFAAQNKLPISKIVMIAVAILCSILYINFLPDNNKSDTLILSCIHLMMFLWSILAFAFIGEIDNNIEKRLGFLKYTGDLVVMTTLIVISGGIMTAVTIGLFSVIGLNIEEFYFNNIVVFVLPAAPIIATYLIQTNPHLIGKVSPVIAKIFSPLVLVMLVIYLVAMTVAQKDPYNDREFLLVFNVLLVGVMAIIFFSVAESKATKSKWEVWVLFLLSAVTIVVNGIALSAILFRISEWGVTPNRIAVLGGNVLILMHLLLVAGQFFKVLSKGSDITAVRKTISFYLPIYTLWTILVIFLFPIIFGFR
jgi:fumarate reductase subunit C